MKRSFQETENPAPPHPPDTSRRLPGSDSARAQGSKAKKQAAAAAKAKDDAQFVKLPIASAKKLRFYDNADLAEIIARHLEEKRSILDDNARVLRALVVALAARWW